MGQGSDAPPLCRNLDGGGWRGGLVFPPDCHGAGVLGELFREGGALFGLCRGCCAASARLRAGFGPGPCRLVGPFAAAVGAVAQAGPGLASGLFVAPWARFVRGPVRAAGPLGRGLRWRVWGPFLAAARLPLVSGLCRVAWGGWFGLCSWRGGVARISGTPLRGMSPMEPAMGDANAAAPPFFRGRSSGSRRPDWAFLCLVLSSFLGLPSRFPFPELDMPGQTA